MLSNAWRQCHTFSVFGKFFSFVCKLISLVCKFTPLVWAPPRISNLCRLSDCWLIASENLLLGANKGRHRKKRHVFFRALPKKGGGVYPCPNILALFHQVKVPKIGTLLLKTNDMCMFFCHHYHQNYHHYYHNYHYNHYYNQLYFFCHMRKTSF